jgi:hypothetical protein
MPRGTGSAFASSPMLQAIISAGIPGRRPSAFNVRRRARRNAADRASGDAASSPPVSSESEVLRHSSLRFRVVRMSEGSGLGW